jgi:uncharacterized damage-inducible protein DinB
MRTELPEVWLRGPIEGFDPLVMPAVHALLQVREDLHRLVATVPSAHLWERPGGAASIGFHLRHTGGALDRLLTYARGESLSAEQLQQLRAEEEPGESIDELGRAVDRRITEAIDQLRVTASEQLAEPRSVGRAGLPSTVGGLVFHAAEHSTRHLGQAMTTARILAGSHPPA